MRMRNPAPAFALLLSCAHTPQAALDAEKISPARARAFCSARHTGATRAAGSCAAICPDKADYCARKNCIIELATLQEWDEVSGWCEKYTPPVYYPRPEWPPKGLTPIVEEDT